MPLQVVVASGPVFAFVQPVSHRVEAQPPAEALHPPADHHDPVATVGEWLIVVIVILIAGWQTIVRVVRVAQAKPED